jgi:hypothetical protein
MTRAHGPLAAHPLRAPVLWGVVWGLIQAASPLGFWWLDPATVYALSLALIAAVYIGFSVADGRWQVIAAESAVAGFFVIVARGQCQRIGLAARARAGRPRPEGSVAAWLHLTFTSPTHRDHTSVL